MNQPIDCQRTRLLLHDAQLGRLDASTSDAVAEHVRTCAECARIDAEERELSVLLETHLQPMAAPARCLRGRRPSPASWSLWAIAWPGSIRWIACA